ncbi:MAG: hypothetical protein R6W77_01075 [Trueperaceae bacterium]
MKHCTRILAIAAALLVNAIAGFAAAQDGTAAPYRVEVPLLNHLQLGMNEQDVFIEHHTDSDLVRRITADDGDASAQLYAAAEPSAHNPVDPADVGPYAKGAALGITQGEWLEGRGEAVITCEGETGTVSATFSDLVPEGVYTLWYFFMALPTTQPFSTYDMPLGARDGSENSFVADEQGNAEITVAVSPCLQLSGRQLLAGLAAAYHSDGQTYGAYPGDFGTISHLHVFNFLPQEAQASAE